MRRPLSSAVLGHSTRAHNRSSRSWWASCTCGWRSGLVRWSITARDAAAAHLLAVQS